MGKRPRGPRHPAKEAARRARQAEIHAARDAARAADLAANPRPSRAVRLDLGLPAEANDELPEEQPEGQQLGEAETSGEEAATDAGWQPARLAWAADLVAAAAVEAQLEEQHLEEEGGEAAGDLGEAEEDEGCGGAAASSGAAAAASSSGEAAAEDVSLSSEGVSVGDLDSVCDFSESDHEEKVPEAYLIDVCSNGFSRTVSGVDRSSQEAYRKPKQARSGTPSGTCQSGSSAAGPRSGHAAWCWH